MSMAGAQGVHLPFLDSSYRNKPAGPELVRCLRTLVAEADTVAVPVGLGHHPDHLEVRDATLCCLADMTPRRVLLYADLPYANRYGWPRWVTSRHSARTSGWDRIGWAPDRTTLSWMRSACLSWRSFPRTAATVVPVTLEEQERKLAAVRCYRTQTSLLGYGDGGPSVRPERLGYEVYWTRPSADR